MAFCSAATNSAHARRLKQRGAGIPAKGPEALPSGLHARRLSGAPLPTEPRLFQRAAGMTMVPNYYHNQIEVAQEFAAYLERGVITPSSFRAISGVLHRIAALGLDEKSPYNPGTHSEDKYRSDEVRPGGIWRRRTRSERSATRAWAVEYTKGVLRHLGLLASGCGEVTIDGIPAWAWPENRGATHVYPPSRHLHLYFARAARILSITQTCRREDVVASVADFHHTMVNARAYESINNSVAMTEVNVLLMRRGFRGVTHGWLDHLAHRLGTANYRLVFRSHWAGDLPDPSKGTS